MKLIKDIEVFDVKDSIYKMVHYYKDHPFDISKDLVPDQQHLITEIIYGRRYINPKTKEEFYLGLSKKAEKILGITFDEFERLWNENQNLNDKLKKKEEFTKKILNDGVNFNHMNYFKRLWLVLTKKYIF